MTLCSIKEEKMPTFMTFAGAGTQKAGLHYGKINMTISFTEDTAYRQFRTDDKGLEFMEKGGLSMNWIETATNQKVSPALCEALSYLYRRNVLKHPLITVVVAERG